jgi:hypothetical protein
MSFVSSIHHPKIMLGMLVKVLCSNSIATRRRLPRESNVTFEDLMRRASDFDVRTVTIEILTSVRYRLPMTVGIVTVITTIRSAGLSCSHETFCIDGEVGARSLRACRNTLVVGWCRAAFCTAPALSRRNARWGRPYFQQFFGAIPRRNRRHWRGPCFNVAASRTWSWSNPKASLCV